MGTIWVDQRKKEIKSNLICRTKTREGRMSLLNVNNLPRKSCRGKLITLRETDLNGWCAREFFVFGREQSFERERMN